MKKLFTFLASITLSVMLFAQAPQSFSYQTVIRDASWNALNNQSVGIKISILEDAANGTVVYEETHSATTTQIGLVNLSVGDGVVMTGVFNTIDWGNHNYFIEVAVDVTGGTTYIVMGTTQLRSVPYALYAETSGTPGTPGPQGIAGNDGVDGVDGTNGVDGVDGAPGVDGTNGTNGVDGNDGIDGTNGTNGVDGNDGVDGTNGVDGIDGIDAVVDYDSLANLISVDSTFITNVGGGMGGGGCHFLFPEGFDGEAITQEINSITAYVVPTGKRLYVTGWKSYDPVIDGITLNFNTGKPLILNAGESLTSTQSSILWSSFNGLLVDQNIEINAVTQEINSITAYVVPTGKRLYVTGWKSSDPVIDGITLNFNTGKPLILNAGESLTSTQSSILWSSFNGYLVDENYFAGCGGGGGSSTSNQNMYSQIGSGLPFDQLLGELFVVDLDISTNYFVIPPGKFFANNYWYVDGAGPTFTLYRGNDIFSITPSYLDPIIFIENDSIVFSYTNSTPSVFLTGQLYDTDPSFEPFFFYIDSAQTTYTVPVGKKAIVTNLDGGCVNVEFNSGTVNLNNLSNSELIQLFPFWPENSQVTITPYGGCSPGTVILYGTGWYIDN